MLTEVVNTMNQRFFNLEQKKQDQILNAAYKVFALHDYKKAPMSEIAAEGNISKSLLFHYFGNKEGLYMYLWNTALNLSSKEMQKYQVYETKDFFEMFERSLKVKCHLMRAYPYLTLFCMNAYYEKDPTIQKNIQSSFYNAKERSFEMIKNKVDITIFRKNLCFKDIYKEILNASDGYLLNQYRLGILDVSKIEKEYSEMIVFWKKAFLENGADCYEEKNV